MKTKFKNIIMTLFFLPAFANALEVSEIIYPGSYKEVRVYTGEYNQTNSVNTFIAADYALPYVYTGEMNGPNSYTPGKEPKLILGGSVVQNWINSNPAITTGTQTLCDISPGSPNCSLYTFPVYNTSAVPMYYTSLTSDVDGRMYNSFLLSLNVSYTVVNGIPIVIGYNDNLESTTPTTPVDNPTPTPNPPTGSTQDCSNPDFTNKTNASICLVGNIIPGCKISSPNYITSINTPAGNVGLTSVELKITCSNGVDYHIKPIHEQISVQGTDETLKLTGWKDGGRGDKLTPLSAKVQSGNGSEQSIPIYFTLEGKGRSAAYGNTIVNPFVGSITYPIQINY